MEQRLNKLYEAPGEGSLWGEMNGDRFEIHSFLVDPIKNIRRFKEVLKELCKQLANRGIDKLYTYADNEMNFRYNKLLGFKSAYVVYDNRFELMVMNTWP